MAADSCMGIDEGRHPTVRAWTGPQTSLVWTGGGRHCGVHRKKGSGKGRRRGLLNTVDVCMNEAAVSAAALPPCRVNVIAADCCLVGQFSLFVGWLVGAVVQHHG
eukprot:364323-Chlamydomonas_euryale.AAC.30